MLFTHRNSNLITVLNLLIVPFYRTDRKISICQTIITYTFNFLFGLNSLVTLNETHRLRAFVERVMRTVFFQEACDINCVLRNSIL